MKKIRISGIGLVSQAGITTEALWERLCSKETAVRQTEEIPFKPAYPASRLRRINRYCKMALYASAEAWKDGNISEEMDAFDRGTIFTTGYGSMAAQVKFYREVAKGEPDFCSPTVFTGTVPNSCVGTVCMFLNCKGASTMLSGGNHLEYSSLLLQNGQAEVILAGAVEEYTKELFEDLAAEPVNRNVPLSEGCVVFALEAEETSDLSAGGEGNLRPEESRSYCFLERTGTTGLPGTPFLKTVDREEAAGRMRELLADYVSDGPDLVLGAMNGSDFDPVEEQVLKELFGEDRIGGSVKMLTGETLGCGFSMNVAAGALCLRHGFVPAALSGRGEDTAVKKILVTGYDSAENYMCALLVR